MNPIGVNHEPIRMFLRTGNDFGNPHKLKDPNAPKPRSITNYEAYATQEKRMRTQGLFMNDKQRLAATKHAAGFQPTEFKQILSLNPSLESYLSKKMALEDKKLTEMKQTKLMMEKEVKLKMQRSEKQFSKANRETMLRTWQKETI